MLNQNIKLAGNDFEFIRCEVWAKWNQKRIRKYLKKYYEKDKEIKEICDYLAHGSIHTFPYDFKDNYDLNKVNAEKDSLTGLIRIEHNGTMLYMRRKYKSLFRAKRYYNNLCIEQDSSSPHRYTTSSFFPDNDCVILDIGGAEGFFSLDYVKNCKKIYIFECEKEWIEALEHTYKDYMGKVVIVDKYVCDYSDEHHITIDDFVIQNNLENEKLFIKMDAEGSEPQIYQGMKQCIQRHQKMKIALCVYHCLFHEQYFREQFQGWKIENSNGYMLYYYDMNYSEPYIRRGVLRVSNYS